MLHLNVKFIYKNQKTNANKELS